EGFRLVAPVEVLRRRDRTRLGPFLRPELLDADEPIDVLVALRIEQDAVDHAEDHAAHADGDGERDDRDDGDARVPKEDPSAVADVPEQAGRHGHALPTTAEGHVRSHSSSGSTMRPSNIWMERSAYPR